MPWIQSSAANTDFGFTVGKTGGKYCGTVNEYCKCKGTVKQPPAGHWFYTLDLI